MANERINFLELVPKKKNKYVYEVDSEGMVQIIIPRSGILDKMVRVIFNTPKVMRIDLDEVGSFVWNSIDDKKNIEAIAQDMKEKFGDKIEPLYQRLATYVNILKNNKFITINKGGN